MHDGKKPKIYALPMLLPLVFDFFPIMYPEVLYVLILYYDTSGYMMERSQKYMPYSRFNPLFSTSFHHVPQSIICFNSLYTVGPQTYDT